jgi:hypothetical protein
MAVHVKSETASNSQPIRPHCPSLILVETKKKYFKTHDPPDESIGKCLKKNQSSEYYAVIHGFYLGVPTIFSS